MNYQPIENYGVIGNLNTVALVGMNGSIDFMCFPRFDSPTIFAALLDHAKGGCFKIAPVSGDLRTRQMYLPDTNILLTRFFAGDGLATLSDFIAIGGSGPNATLVRRLKVVRGEIQFRMTCAPRFDYGRAGHKVERRESEIIFRETGGGKSALRLHASVPVKISNGDAVTDFRLRAGETVSFVLEDAGAGESTASANADFVSAAFKQTMNFWLRWIGRSKYRGRWREIVNRSMLTLKLLCSREFGSVIAAPTFSLPERIGGGRNWDYRFTWVRDASFTVDAFMRLGYTEEAAEFMRWIEERCRQFNPERPLQVLYGLDGRADLAEKELPQFEGYRQSRPVRIGNAACRQFQLDIYGELLDSALIYQRHNGKISRRFWKDLVRLSDWVCANWRKPDESIWEVRGGAKPFLFSRLMCWVAVDRAMQLAQKLSPPATLAQWRRTRGEIHRDIQKNFWNAKMKSFVQFQGAKTVDSSSLLMPRTKFIRPDDPRWKSTLAAIEKNLLEDSLVYRYRGDGAAADGLSGGEGTFSMCSFWYVECLALSGDLRQARFIFEKSLSYANHLGLYAEQLGPQGEHLGNFPQALSHIGLVNAAWDLDRKLDQAGET
jgi:GH15 family glucan-1,4-alpha-glucosidase